MTSPQIQPFQQFIDDGENMIQQEKVTSHEQNGSEIKSAADEKVDKKRKKSKKKKRNSGDKNVTLESVSSSHKKKKHKKDRDKKDHTNDDADSAVKKKKHKSKHKHKHKSKDHDHKKSVSEKNDVEAIPFTDYDNVKSHQAIQSMADKSIGSECRTNENRAPYLDKSNVGSNDFSLTSPMCDDMQTNLSTSSVQKPKRRVPLITLSRSASPCLTPLRDAKHFIPVISNPPSVQTVISNPPSVQETPKGSPAPQTTCTPEGPKTVSTPFASPDSTSQSFIASNRSKDCKKSVKKNVAATEPELSECLPDSSSSVSKDSKNSDTMKLPCQEKCGNYLQVESMSEDKPKNDVDESTIPFKKRKLSFETISTENELPNNLEQNPSKRIRLSHSSTSKSSEDISSEQCTVTLNKTEDAKSKECISSVSDRLKATPTKHNPESLEGKCSTEIASNTPSKHFNTSVCQDVGLQNISSEKDNFSTALSSLTSLNDDSFALSTDIHKLRTPKKSAKKEKKTPNKKTPAKIRFQFTTPSKSSTKSKQKSQTPSSNVVKSSKRRLYPDDDEKPSTSGTQKSKGKKSVKSEIEVDDDDEWATDEEDHSIVVPDVEMDRKLDEKANKPPKLKLTVKNVRTILHGLVTNPSVLAMVQKQLKDDEALRDQFKEAIEPKMTRAKMKEVMKTGKLPEGWSPLKLALPQPDQPGFLDLTFEEDESDQDFDPNKLDLEHTDDDDESVMSSVGSPCLLGCSTPTLNSSLNTTSALSQSSILNRSFSQDFTIPRRNLNADFLSPNLVIQTSQDVPAAFRTRSKKPLNDKDIAQLEEDLYKAPIVELEQEEVIKAPDLYQQYFDINLKPAEETALDKDPDWLKFLASLNKDDMNDTFDDEQNDPEFDFMKEVGNEPADPLDERCNRATEIPKRELKVILEDQHYWLDGDFDDLWTPPVTDTSPKNDVKKTKAAEKPEEVENDKNSTKCQTAKKCVRFSDNLPTPSKKTSTNKKEESEEETLRPEFPKYYSPHDAALMMNATGQSSLLFDVENKNMPTMSESHLNQIQDQMRKFTQLATQTYIMTNGLPDLKTVRFSVKQLMVDISVRRKISPVGPEKSMFNVPFLDEALTIVSKDLDLSENCEEQKCLLRTLNSDGIGCYRQKSTYLEQGLHYRQMDLMVNSRVFMFPQMLPDVRFYLQETQRKRVAFTEAEDNLLAIGLDIFKDLHGTRYQQIRYHLLPTKQQDQLRYRVKNAKARHKKDKKTNAILHLDKVGKLPEFTRYEELEDVEEIVPPRDRDRDFLPHWYDLYEKVHEKLKTSVADCQGDNNASVHNSAASSSTPQTRDRRESEIDMDGDKTLAKSAAKFTPSRKSVTKGKEIASAKTVYIQPKSPLITFSTSESDTDSASHIECIKSQTEGLVVLESHSQLIEQPLPFTSSVDQTTVHLSPNHHLTTSISSSISSIVPTIAASLASSLAATSSLQTTFLTNSCANVVNTTTALQPAMATTSKISETVICLTAEQLKQLETQGSVCIGTVGDGGIAPSEACAPLSSSGGQMEVASNTEIESTPMTSSGSQIEVTSNMEMGSTPPEMESTPMTSSGSQIEVTSNMEVGSTPPKLNNISAPTSSGGQIEVTSNTEMESTPPEMESTPPKLDEVSVSEEQITPKTVSVSEKQATPEPVHVQQSQTPAVKTTGKSPTTSIMVSTPLLEGYKKGGSVRSAEVGVVVGVGHVLNIPNTPEKIVFRDASPSNKIMALAFSSATGIPVEALEQSPKLIPQILGLSPCKDSPKKVVRMPRVRSVRKQLSVITEDKEDDGIVRTPLRGTKESRPISKFSLLLNDDDDDDDDVLATPLKCDEDSTAKANSFKGLNFTPSLSQSTSGLVSSAPAVDSFSTSTSVVSAPTTTSTVTVSVTSASDAALTISDTQYSQANTTTTTMTTTASNLTSFSSVLSAHKPASAPEDSDFMANLKLTPPRPSTSGPFKIPVTPGGGGGHNTNTSTMFNTFTTSLDLNMLTDHSMLGGGDGSHHPSGSHHSGGSHPSILTTPTKVHHSDSTMWSPYRPSPSASERFSSPPDTPETPTKRAVEMMAQAAKEMQITPPKKYWSPGGSSLRGTPGSSQSTPDGRSPSKLLKTPPKSPRWILPKSPSPLKGLSSPLLPKIKKSPRRQLLNNKVRSILPKGLLLSSPVKILSPVKMVAAQITAKARHIAQSPKSDKTKVTPQKRPLVRQIFSPDSVASSKGDNSDSEESESEADLDGGSVKETTAASKADEENEDSEVDALADDGSTADEMEDDDLPEEEKEQEAEEPEEAEEVELEESEEEDVDEEEDYLARLNAASSTIHGAEGSIDQEIIDSEMLKSRQELKRLKTLQMLQPNIVENDPKRDEKDTALAKSYLKRIKEALATDKYAEFLSLLSEFEKTRMEPVELFGRVHDMLVDHPDLAEDFAGFLRPGQAYDADASTALSHYEQARRFLRKLEISFRHKPSCYHEVMALLSSCKDARRLEQELRPLLKGHSHILEEAKWFFMNNLGGPRKVDTFESVTLPNSSSDSDKEAIEDEENKERPVKKKKKRRVALDGFEEIEVDMLEEGQFGTQWCGCTCHNDPDSDHLLTSKRRHCIDCALKIRKGKVYMQTEHKLQKMRFLYPVKEDSSESDTEDGSSGSGEENEDEEAVEKRIKIKLRIPPKQPDSQLADNEIKSEGEMAVDEGCTDTKKSDKTKKVKKKKKKKDESRSKKSKDKSKIKNSDKKVKTKKAKKRKRTDSEVTIPGDTDVQNPTKISKVMEESSSDMNDEQTVASNKSADLPVVETLKQDAHTPDVCSVSQEVIGAGDAESSCQSSN